jgi:hypothetical protein
MRTSIARPIISSVIAAGERASLHFGPSPRMKRGLGPYDANTATSILRINRDLER